MATTLTRRCRRSDAAHGLTLVELLVTIMIIGMLASAVLFAMSVAQESARKARTQALVTTLHTLLLEQYDQYLTRRYHLTYNLEIANADRREAAKLRLKTARQFLKMDFPDQWSDITQLTTGTDAFNPTGVSALWSYYNSEASRVSTFVGSDPDSLMTKNQGAECLYMIISSIRGEAGNWRKVNDDFIGDTDGDSALEYLDGWGRPMEFMRWPAGFPSPMHAIPLTVTAPATSRPTFTATAPTDMFTAAQDDHDPFDPMRVEPLNYRIVPLIFSAGPDGIYDLAKPQLNYGNSTDINNRWVPYYFFLFQYKINGTNQTRYCRMGHPVDVNDDGLQGWHDNIHNHLIE